MGPRPQKPLAAQIADRDYFRRRSCETKRTYQTKAMAEYERSCAGWKFDEAKPYRCGFCGKWHLGRGFNRQEDNEWRKWTPDSADGDAGSPTRNGR